MRASEKRRSRQVARSDDHGPNLWDKRFWFHNGKVHTPVFVTENMVGHRLESFRRRGRFRAHGAHTEKLSRSNAAPEPVWARAWQTNGSCAVILLL